MSLRSPSLDEFVKQSPTSLDHRGEFPCELPVFVLGMIRTPSWARGYDDPVLVAQGDRHHECDFGAQEPTPICYYGNKDVEWSVREREFEDGWTETCDVCAEEVADVE